MTKEALILHDALDYIDTATSKAALVLENVADYFDPEPVDPARVIGEQATIRTLVNIGLDYLNTIKRQYIEAMTATAHTNDHSDTDRTSTQPEPDTRSHSADHDSTEASSPSTNAAHKPAEQAEATNDKSAAHTPSAAPMTAEQAAERIQYISIEDATDSTATAYKDAIIQWVNETEPETPAQYMTFALAYAAGLQEGKRQERQRRH